MAEYSVNKYDFNNNTYLLEDNRLSDTIATNLTDDNYYMVIGRDYVTAGQLSGTTLGTVATAEGWDTTASGYASHAEGDNTTASRYASHAEGGFTTASGNYSHAEGNNTTAGGYASHAEGDNTTASGYASHAEGGYTAASGEFSHAKGYHTTASGNYSHAEGWYTTAQRRSQHVFGEYNVLDTTGSTTSNKGSYIEIVGNGTSNSARSNARTLDWSGNETLAGKLTLGAGPVNNMDATTKQYVDTAIGNAASITMIDHSTNTTTELNNLTINKLSQAQYDAIATPDSNQLYMITDDTIYAEKTYVDNLIANIDALPSQSGNSGKYLTTNGTSASWATINLTSLNASNLTSGTVSWDRLPTSRIYDATASRTANTVLAAPNGSAGAASFRALVAADIPNLNTGKITSGTLGIARGGTGLTSSPSMLTNLGSTTAANVFAASPRPGVTGTLPIANGGTGGTTAATARANLGTLGSKSANGYEGMTDMAGADNVWIRTTSQGIIPYQSGGSTAGHSYLGTSSWYFYQAYIQTVYSNQTFGAVWNDYAEYRQLREDQEIPYGHIVIENGDDTLSLSTERLQPGGQVVSDTFGFAIGQTEKCKLPIAVSGRALVYTYEDRNTFAAGDAVCSGPNGTVSKMTREEIKEYPERIIGTVSAIPEYENWGEGNVKVDGRIWIYIK